MHYKRIDKMNIFTKEHPVLAVEYDGTKRSIDSIRELSKKDKKYSVKIHNGIRGITKRLLRLL